MATPNALADAPSENTTIAPHNPANQFHKGIFRVFYQSWDRRELLACFFARNNNKKHDDQTTGERDYCASISILQPVSQLPINGRLHRGKHTG
ncbi:hypothetical protein [Citrobacter freundii]|uniref:Uncharacterized protein n=1 Tax=Citrobacter freundii TaxID=546 RepID=A0A7G2IGH1_CITFR|nr:hypothetical protein [Citrobacter freundii]